MLLTDIFEESAYTCSEAFALIPRMSTIDECFPSLEGTVHHGVSGGLLLAFFVVRTVFLLPLASLNSEIPFALSGEIWST